MFKFTCSVCGYIHEGAAAPEKCPMCGASFSKVSAEEEEDDKNPIKVSIVGMTGSGKTVLITTLSIKMVQMSLPDIFMAPCGKNRRKTIQYTQRNWQMLSNGQWPASTPAGELVELQWELNTKNHQAVVQFLDCAGQDIHSLFNTDEFDPDSLGEDLRKVYQSVNVANILVFLVNMRDLLATSDSIDKLLDLDQMIYTLKSRNEIPRRVAVVFSQFDKYKPEVDQKYNGDFLQYIRHYLPYLYGQYVREGNFEIIPVAAVNDTQTVVENGEVRQYPAPDYSSYNLEKLIYWIAQGVEELPLEIAEAQERKRREEAKRKQEEKLKEDEKLKRLDEAEQQELAEKEKSQKDNGIFLTVLILWVVFHILLFACLFFFHYL